MKYSRLRSYSLYDSMHLTVWKRQNTRGWRWEYWIYYKGTKEHYRGKWTVLYLDCGGGYRLHDSYEWPENYEWQPSVSSEADVGRLRVLLSLSLSNTISVPSGDEMTKTPYGQNLDCWDHVEKKPGDQLDQNCPWWVPWDIPDEGVRNKPYGETVSLLPVSLIAYNATLGDLPVTHNYQPASSTWTHPPFLLESPLKS